MEVRNAALIAITLLCSYAASAQAPAARPKFDASEVATVKPVDPGQHAGRMFKMDGPHRWGATNYTLKIFARPDDPPEFYGVVHPGKNEVPAKSVTMDDFVAMLQRANLDRPTVNRTGLAGKYDFDPVWARDESQNGGEIEKAPDDAGNPPLFTAMQEQLGLKL